MINAKVGYKTPGYGWQPTYNEKKRTAANKGVFESEHFKNLCDIAGIKVTKRQASKYNNYKGMAYKCR